MTHVVDTCVLSEITKKNPNKVVIEYLESLPPKSTYVSIITIGELLKGLKMKIRKHDSFKYKKYEERILEVVEKYNIVNIDWKVSMEWSTILASGEAKGKKPPEIDALIAATAVVYHSKVVTSNIKHFELCDVEIINPTILTHDHPYEESDNGFNKLEAYMKYHLK